MRSAAFVQLRCVGLHPPEHACMVRRQSPFPHQLGHVAVAQRKIQAPAHATKDDLSFVMSPVAGVLGVIGTGSPFYRTGVDPISQRNPSCPPLVRSAGHLGCISASWQVARMSKGRCGRPGEFHSQAVRRCCLTQSQPRPFWPLQIFATASQVPDRNTTSDPIGINSPGISSGESSSSSEHRKRRRRTDDDDDA